MNKASEPRGSLKPLDPRGLRSEQETQAHSYHTLTAQMVTGAREMFVQEAREV